MPETIASDPETLTETVVERIADAEGAGIYDVPPLFDSIDPDALEALFAESEVADHLTVEFSHAGYRIRVDGGRVSLERPGDGS
jgi:hypothetical protein